MCDDGVGIVSLLWPVGGGFERNRGKGCPTDRELFEGSVCMVSGSMVRDRERRDRLSGGWEREREWQRGRDREREHWRGRGAAGIVVSRRGEAGLD